MPRLPPTYIFAVMCGCIQALNLEFIIIQLSVSVDVARLAVWGTAGLSRILQDSRQTNTALLDRIV